MSAVPDPLHLDQLPKSKPVTPSVVVNLHATPRIPRRSNDDQEKRGEVPGQRADTKWAQKRRTPDGPAAERGPRRASTGR
jgi:hypothetical protein